MIEGSVRVSVEDIVAVVDELTIASADTPGSSRIRLPLLTVLREERATSLGATGRGRGSGRGIPLSADAWSAWSEISATIEELHATGHGEKPRRGSLEQILAGWARDVAAADADSRMRQWSTGVEETGLNQDALRQHLRDVEWIRDRIRRVLDPAASGDIPKAKCPLCGLTRVEVVTDGDVVEMPAIGFTRDTDGAIHQVTCRNPACRGTWTGWEGLQALRRHIELVQVFGTVEGS